MSGFIRLLFAGEQENETHFSTVRHPSQADTWFSCPDENKRRCSSHSCPPCQGSCPSGRCLKPSGIHKDYKRHTDNTYIRNRSRALFTGKAASFVLRVNTGCTIQENFLRFSGRSVSEAAGLSISLSGRIILVMPDWV